MKLALFFFLLLNIENARAFVPAEAYTFDFNIKTVRMGRMKEEKLFESVEILRRVFSSPEFKRKILSHRFKGRYQFAQNKGLSNRQIYQRILTGMEKLHPYKNNAMDVEIELYSDYSSNVLGFTLPRSKRIWMNTKYFNRNKASQIASNLTHEWLHKLGFGHSRERTSDRKFTVPYAIGYIVRDLAREFDEDRY